MKFADRDELAQMSDQVAANSAEVPVFTRGNNIIWIDEEGSINTFYEHKVDKGHTVSEPSIHNLTTDGDTFYFGNLGGPIRDIETEDIVVEADELESDKEHSSFQAIEVFDGDLYAAYGDGIWNVDEMERVAEREVKDLEVYRGELYDIGNDIRTTIDNEEILSKGGSTLAGGSKLFFSYKDHNFDGGEDNYPIETIDGEEMKNDSKWVRSMAIVDGEIHYNSDYSVRKLDRALVEYESDPGNQVLQICSAPRELVENLRGDPQ